MSIPLAAGMVCIGRRMDPTVATPITGVANPLNCGLFPPT